MDKIEGVYRIAEAEIRAFWREKFEGREILWP